METLPDNLGLMVIGPSVPLEPKYMCPSVQLFHAKPAGPWRYSTAHAGRQAGSAPPCSLAWLLPVVQPVGHPGQWYFLFPSQAS